MTSETITLKGMCFQLVDNQVAFNWLTTKWLSTQGQPDGGVNLHRLTGGLHAVHRHQHLGVVPGPQQGLYEILTQAKN